jgi:hypothetical protein
LKSTLLLVGCLCALALAGCNKGDDGAAGTQPDAKLKPATAGGGGAPPIAPDVPASTTGK